MNPTPMHRLKENLRIRMRRILRGVITVALGVVFLIGLPGNTGVGSLLASLFNGAVFALLFLPLYAPAGAVFGMLMPRLARWRPLPLALAVSILVGAAFGLALEFASPPHGNPLTKLVHPPHLPTVPGSPAHSDIRLARHWVSSNWSACFLAAWFAGWTLHERRRPEVPLPSRQAAP